MIIKSQMFFLVYYLQKLRIPFHVFDISSGNCREGEGYFIGCILKPYYYTLTAWLTELTSWWQLQLAVTMGICYPLIAEYEQIANFLTYCTF